MLQVTVLDKSQADWNEHKKEAGVDADLAHHQRSSNRCAACIGLTLLSCSIALPAVIC